jgi:ubiquinone/menaquinone biosynthesis C-methylase UbiE/DNA-directed RNA polymerase subunit RPC12/RpoP
MMSTGTAAIMAGTPKGIALRCIRCGSELAQNTFQVACSDCGSQWPVVNRIPRFYQPADDYYWGEISRQEARDLLADARTRSWENAIRSRFGYYNPLYQYYLDLQRAAWLPLFGLDSTAVALDIGCGYGAITHSLALSVKEVHAIEAIPERIEFTQERLLQEGISNVSLLQASATALPFFENSFDLIVANGILEWVGEWDLEGSPRAAQLRFLSTLLRLLKSNGALVIGIENRFGMPLLRGGMDHSGLPYTSLVPRWLATRMLQRAQGPHFRMTLNSRREYRTYTYTCRGYRKLLRQAGFNDVSVYWAHPGYNRPHRLIPIEAKPLVADCYRALEEDRPASRGSTWRRKAKRILSAWLAPEFVLIAYKDSRRTTRVLNWLQKSLGQQMDCRVDSNSGKNKVFVAAYTHPYRHKSILSFWSPKLGRIPAIAKANSRRISAGPGSVESESRNLAKIRSGLRLHPEIRVGVPEPIGWLKEGTSSYVLESLAKGVRFSSVINHPDYTHDLARVEKDFTQAVSLIVELSRVLQEIPDIPAISPSWYQLANELTEDEEWAERVRRLRYFSDWGPNGKTSWVQHGDFWPEHLFLDQETGRAEIIDWDDLAAGLPPLYDVFSFLLYSRLLNASTECAPNIMSHERLQAAFSEAFLQDGPLAQLFGKLLTGACEQVQLDPKRIPSLLAEFLLMRAHRYAYYDQPIDSQLHLNLLRAYMDHFSL